jgi:hypothetical protein
MTKIELQRLAMLGYHPEDYPPATLTDDIIESDAIGDTLAQFIWREVGDADGHPEEAIRMLEQARDELNAVITIIERHQIHTQQ